MKYIRSCGAFKGADMSDIHSIIRDQIKEPLWDNWYIKGELGRGASGVVYRIEARRENRIDVSALKIEPIVADESVYVDEARRRDYLEKKRIEAENETTIMYKLRSSPNIVLYEDETIKPLIHEGRQLGYYMLIRMECLTCLQKLMREGKFDTSQANVMKLAIDIGSGIKAAHDLGVIHRDIKPGNFFVSDSGVYKLGDFNISKKSVSARSFAGTEGYIAPEIYFARYGTDGYTKQADIYSFGIALYCLMNDYQFPFGDVCLPEEAIERRMNGEALPAPKHASPEFAAVILKACAFSTANRYQNMGDMLRDLRAIEGRTSVQAPVQNTDRTVFSTGTMPLPGNNASYQGAPQNSYPQNSNPFSRAADNYGTVYSRQSQPPAGGQQYAPSYNYPAEEKTSAAPKIILLIALVLILVIFGIILFFLMNRDDDDGGSGRSKDSSSSAMEEGSVKPSAEEGTAEVTETAAAEPETTAETTTTQPVTRDTKVVLDKEYIELETGDTEMIMPMAYPAGSTESDEIWRSTDPSVAEVDSMGNVTAVGAGECEIILTFSNNPAAEARVTVSVTEPMTMPPVTPNDSGAGASNILNGGYACLVNGQMFYSDGNKIYSVTGSKTKAICNYGAHYMNSIGDYIYFCNGSADNCLCSVRSDGSDFKVIRSNYCYELTYSDGWLYFSEIDGNTNYICRMKPDGSDYTRLRQVKCWYMCVNSGKIYYVNYDNNYSLDVMNTDGSGNTTLSSEQTSDLCIAGGRLYYSADRDKRWLYSMALDGSGKVLLRDDYSKHTNIIGTQLYCTDEAHHLVVINLANSTGKVYSELGYVSFPVIVGSTLYSSGEDGSINIYDISNT